MSAGNVKTVILDQLNERPNIQTVTIPLLSLDLLFFQTIYP